MNKFSENDLKEKFEAKNDKTGEQIVVFHYSKLSEDGKYFCEFTCGDGRALSPRFESKNKFIHLLSGDTFTRV